MKILIIDDSVVYRMAIKQALEEIEDFSVVGALSNGQLAVDWISQNREVDLMTLDMEMPQFDGLSTIKAVRKINKKIPIVVFSSNTTKGAEKTIDALSSGANDFVTKEEASTTKTIEGNLEMIRQSLVPKIKALVRKTTLAKDKIKPFLQTSIPTPSKPSSLESLMTIKPKIILMASSTGGPDALMSILRSLKKGKMNIPILIVQHMPPIFTRRLAMSLDNICGGYQIKEAQEGDELIPGVCYMAPGDYHMTLGKDKKIRLNQNEKVCFVRPAANCLFESVANNFRGQIASFTLTGMGEDGALGVKQLHKVGAYNFYQDEESCAVFGMPGSVKNLGTAQEIKLPKISEIINLINSRV